MIRNKYVSFVLFIACFTSCKKNNNTAETGNYGNSSNNLGYYGILSIYQQQTVNSGSIGSPNSPFGIAFFSITQTTIINPSTFAKVDSVKLNNVKYKFYSYDYLDSSSHVTSAPFIWSVYSGGFIPSFTYTNSNPMPSYTGYNLLPDTIYKTQKNIIQITGITGADTTIVYIEDLAAHETSQILYKWANTVTFSATSLSSINTGKNASLIVECKKNNIQSFGGKTFNFPLFYQVTKTVFIK